MHFCYKMNVFAYMFTSSTVLYHICKLKMVVHVILKVYTAILSVLDRFFSLHVSTQPGFVEIRQNPHLTFLMVETCYIPFMSSFTNYLVKIYNLTIFYLCNSFAKYFLCKVFPLQSYYDIKYEICLCMRDTLNLAYG